MITTDIIIQTVKPNGLALPSPQYCRQARVQKAALSNDRVNPVIVYQYKRNIIVSTSLL